MSDDVDAILDEEAAGSGGWWPTVRSWGTSLLIAVAAFQGVGWLRAPDLPEQAPDFALQDLDGQVVHLSDFRGTPVVVNFWATWCGPCKVEIPSFTAFAESHPDVVVLGVAADGEHPRLRQVSEQLGIGYPVLRGGRDVLNDYGVSVFPTTVVVDAEGNVSTAHAGMMFRPQLWWATLGL